jgi:hypothetical protein
MVELNRLGDSPHLSASKQVEAGAAFVDACESESEKITK